jgi:hypothetical protein
MWDCDLYEFDRDAPSNDRRSTLQGRQSNVVFRVKETVNLGAAGFEQRGHLVFGDFLFLHGLRELPRNDLLGRLPLRFRQFIRKQVPRR